MTVRHRIAAAIALALAIVAEPLAQQRKGFLLFTDPSRRYSVEFPQGWDWTVVAKNWNASGAAGSDITRRIRWMRTYFGRISTRAISW